MMYRLYKTSPEATEPNAAVTVGISPTISFLFDPDNRDYQEYLKWISEGNQPLPADE